MGVKVIKYKKEEWQEVADCIRSDQVPALKYNLYLIKIKISTSGIKRNI
jgi:hypothetical protein